MNPKTAMIRLTRLNGNELVVNAELLKFVEHSGDTVITLTTGEKIVVTENTDEVIALAIAYRATVNSGVFGVRSDG